MTKWSPLKTTMLRSQWIPKSSTDPILCRGLEPSESAGVERFECSQKSSKVPAESDTWRMMMLLHFQWIEYSLNYHSSWDDVCVCVCLLNKLEQSSK